jgi:hypothetical protein
MPKQPVEQRFWTKVDKNGPVCPVLGTRCWLWMASTRGTGPYGRFKVDGRDVVAHRFAYELTKGAIPDGFQVDHRCRNRLCVNPAHLRVVTQKQNQENRKRDRGAHWHRGANQWIANVRHNKRLIHVGYFKTEKKALEAARLKRLELFTHNELDRAG